jgi:hypothetical protein
VRELQNVVESLIWTAGSSVVRPEHLPGYLYGPADGRVLPARERRRQLADDLFEGLVNGGLSFWDHVHPMFMDRDLTRHDLRELVRKGLSTTSGNYRALLRMFGMADKDYKRFLNFLATHDCTVDYRTFRRGGADATDSCPVPAVTRPRLPAGGSGPRP